MGGCAGARALACKHMQARVCHLIHIRYNNNKNNDTHTHAYTHPHTHTVRVTAVEFIKAADQTYSRRLNKDEFYTIMSKLPPADRC